MGPISTPTITMQLKKEVFDSLIELYPETAKNIRMRGLEKRDVYMYYLERAQARKGDLDEKKLAVLKKKSTFEGYESEEDEHHISKPFEKDAGKHLELITGKP